MPPQPDPEIWRRPQVAAAVAAHDFPAVFRAVNEAGYTHHAIGMLTGMSQPQVSAIVGGRKPQVFAVIARIVDGLGIPRCLAGLACGPCAGHHQATI